jgi:MATE family multidrug resistance protein
MSGWGREMIDLWRLAAPVIVARAGIMTMALVDTVMVARYSAEELAFQSIANAVTGTVLTTLLGLLLGTLVLAAQAFGARRLEECGAVWRRSVLYALAMGVLGAGFCALGTPILRLLGQTEEIARGGGAVMLVFGLALPSALVAIATTFFLEGIRRPLPGMVVTIVANLLNVLLNWVFVWGHLGAPALGAVGSAAATAGVRFAMMAALVAYVWWMPGHDAFAGRRRRPWRWAAGAEQRRVGYGGASASASRPRPSPGSACSPAGSACCRSPRPRSSSTSSPPSSWWRSASPRRPACASASRPGGAIPPATRARAGPGSVRKPR